MPEILVLSIKNCTLQKNPSKCKDKGVEKEMYEIKSPQALMFRKILEKNNNDFLENFQEISRFFSEFVEKMY